MSLLATINLLQAHHRAIAGVKAAPEVADYPNSLNRVELPMVLTWPDRGGWQQQASGALRRQDRQFRVQVFVQAVAQDRALGNNLVRVAELVQALGERYLNTDTIALANPSNGGYQVTLLTEAGNLSDSGLAVLVYAGTEYHGVEFTVGVYEKW